MTSLIRAGLALAIAAAPLGLATTAHAQAAQGAALFKTTCALCHETVAGKIKIGPPLAGINGRKAGTIPGFNYSAAMKNSGIVWNAAKLAAYIDDPRKTVPGNRMPFFGTKDPAKAKAIADYLVTLK